MEAPAPPADEVVFVRVRAPRRPRRKLPPVAPAFGGSTRGATLGHAPRPCLLPGPQDYEFPRNLTQKPAEPGPGAFGGEWEEPADALRLRVPGPKSK